MAELESLDARLERAEDQLQAGQTEEAEDTLDSVRADLARIAERMVKLTRPSAAQQDTIRDLTAATIRLERLELAAETAEAAEELAEHADEPAGAPVAAIETPTPGPIEVTPETVPPTPAEVLAARLKGRPLMHWV